MGMTRRGSFIEKASIDFNLCEITAFLSDRSICKKIDNRIGRRTAEVLAEPTAARETIENDKVLTQ
jgi:hypothetical protein